MRSFHPQANEISQSNADQEQWRIFSEMTDQQTETLNHNVVIVTTGQKSENAANL
jgi:hypothetical protein